MACFSSAFFEQLIINIIIIVALVMIMRVLIPWLLSLVGGGGPIMEVINIVIWAIVLIFCVYIVFGFLGCLGGFHIGSFR